MQTVVFECKDAPTGQAMTAGNCVSQPVPCDALDPNLVVDLSLSSASFRLNFSVLLQRLMRSIPWAQANLPKQGSIPT